MKIPYNQTRLLPWNYKHFSNFLFHENSKSHDWRKILTIIFKLTDLIEIHKTTVTCNRFLVPDPPSNRTSFYERLARRLEGKLLKLTRRRLWQRSKIFHRRTELLSSTCTPLFPYWLCLAFILSFIVWEYHTLSRKLERVNFFCGYSSSGNFSYDI